MSGFGSLSCVGSHVDIDIQDGGRMCLMCFGFAFSAVLLSLDRLAK
jgi:hypothetical protein